MLCPAALFFVFASPQDSSMPACWARIRTAFASSPAPWHIHLSPVFLSLLLPHSLVTYWCMARGRQRPGEEEDGRSLRVCACMRLPRRRRAATARAWAADDCTRALLKSSCTTPPRPTKANLQTASSKPQHRSLCATHTTLNDSVIIKNFTASEHALSFLVRSSLATTRSLKALII